MKKFLAILLFSIVCLTYVDAQNLALNWAKRIGSPNQESIKKITYDTLGNVYITGTYKGEVDFDPNEEPAILQAVGEEDVYFTKFDSEGNLIWARSLGGPFKDDVNDIIVLKNGDVIIGGVFRGEAEFDPTGKNSTVLGVLSGDEDGYFAKYNSEGELLWAKNIGGSIVAMDTDNNGNIYTTGVFYGTENFNPNASTATATAIGLGDIYYAKYSSNGAYTWHFSVGSVSEDIASDIKLDTEANLYLVGSVEATADMNPASGVAMVNPNNGKAGFIAKYSNNAASFQWVKSFVGASADCLFSSIAIENKKNGNIYFAGTFESTIDFNPATAVNNLTSNGGFDVFLLKLNSLGEYVWANSLGSVEFDDTCNQLAIDSLSNIYITGGFYELVDIDFSSNTKELASTNEKDIYLAKYDKNSNYIWGYSLGGDKIDEGISIAAISNKVLLLGGHFDDIIDIDPGEDALKFISDGEGDVFFSKYNTCGRIETVNEINSCKPVTYNGQTYTKSTVLTNNLSTKDGCDSTFIVSIKIETIATSLKSTACDSFVYNNKTYKQSGNFVDVLKSKDGCDSTFTLALTINKSQNGVLTQTACQSFSLNGQTYTKTGTYSQNLKTKKGCDSLLTLNLTISNSVEASIERTACDTYSLNGQTYNTTGTYTQLLKTSNGCDSTLTLKLTLNKSVTSNLDKTACDSYAFNGQTYTASGTYTAKLKTSNGCDSTVVLKLTINSVKATATINQKALTATPAGATYQWLDCAKNKAPIANATQQTYAPTVNGTYAVSVTQNGCSSVSDCINLIIIAANDNVFSNNITIFPNPSNGKYMIKFDYILNKVDVKVMDINGRQLMKKDNADINNLTIDISDYENGVYLLNIISDKKEATFKLIKQ